VVALLGIGWVEDAARWSGLRFGLLLGAGACLSGMAVRSPRVIPWIIIAVVAVPLVVAGFLAMRRNTAATELAAGNDENAHAHTEQEFAEAEAYEAKWHEEDKDRYHQERLP
jgi:flagellar basal body-associated protein FliL